ADLERLSGGGLVADLVSRPSVVRGSLADSPPRRNSIRCGIYGPLAAQMEKFAWNSAQAGDTDSPSLGCGMHRDGSRAHRGGHVSELARSPHDLHDRGVFLYWRAGGLRYLCAAPPSRAHSNCRVAASPSGACPAVVGD